MAIPKWIRSLTTMLSVTDRRLGIPKVALGATIASLSAGAASAQGIPGQSAPLPQGSPAHAGDIQDPIDSGFTRNNQKYVLTATDSFVIRRTDTLRFSRDALGDAGGVPRR